MKTIHKYPFAITAVQTLEIQQPAKFLHIGLDPNGQPCIWAEVNTDHAFNNVTLFVVGTGNALPNGRSDYLGSFNQGPFVRHIYIA